nr:hypothetical protein BaRGS_027151 [Batillaria attramentaria]
MGVMCSEFRKLQLHISPAEFHRRLCNFTGSNCQDLSDPCLSNPCRNGSSCYHHGTSYICVCPSGYNGANCDDQIASDSGDESLVQAGVQLVDEKQQRKLDRQAARAEERYQRKQQRVLERQAARPAEW